MGPGSVENRINFEEQDVAFDVTLPRVTPADATPYVRYRLGNGGWLQVPVQDKAGGGKQVVIRACEGELVTFQSGYLEHGKTDIKSDGKWIGPERPMTVAPVISRSPSNPAQPGSPGTLTPPVPAVSATPASPATSPAAPAATPNALTAPVQPAAPNALKPLVYPAPTPDTISAEIRQPIAAILESVRDQTKVAGIDAAFDLLEQAIADWVRLNQPPPVQQSVLLAHINQELVTLISHDANVPKQVKATLKKGGKAPASLTELADRLKEGDHHYRIKVLTFLKQNGECHDFFKISSAGDLNPERPFKVEAYNKAFRRVVGSRTYGPLGPRLVDAMDAITTVSSARSLELTQKRHAKAAEIKKEMLPEKKTEVEKWLKSGEGKVINMALQGAGYYTLFGATWPVGLGLLAGRKIIKETLGFTFEDVKTAWRDNAPLDFLKHAWGNTIFNPNRHKNRGKGLGEDLLGSLKNIGKGFIPFHPLVEKNDTQMVSTTDEQKAEQYLQEACARAAA